MSSNNSIVGNNSSAESNLLLLSRVRLIVKFYIWPLLVSFGLIGNCLSIIVLTRRRLIRTSTNNYLTILAVFDSCYLLFTLILNFGSHPNISNSSFIQTLLYIMRPLADFSSNTATWLIVCFTLERTLAVARPIYAKRTCSVRRSRHVICTVLVACFLITLPTYFEKNLTLDVIDIDNKNTTNNAESRTLSSKQKELFLTLHRLYLIFICIVIIWIPLTLLCICNSILIWYVHRSRRFDIDLQTKPVDETSPITPSPSSITKSSYSSNNYNPSALTCSQTGSNKNPCSFNLRRHRRADIRKRKVTIVLIFCLFVALLLWSPQSLSLTYETLIESYSNMSSDRRTIVLIFNNFANLFLCINASIDFILYCFLSEKFARTCQQIIWRQCSNHTIHSNLRSRMRAIDRGSFIGSNTSSHTHRQQQQQLAANRTNRYYTHLYSYYRYASLHEKNTEWKKKFVQTSSTTPTNSKDNNRVYYRTSLIENKQKTLAVKRKLNERRLVEFQKSTDLLSTTEDDYIKNELNVVVNTSIRSNRQSPTNTICNL